MPPALATTKRSATVTRPYGGIQAEARRQERRQRLLAAGLTVFGEHGYHHTTVRDICEAAGLTERYFYESFKTLRLLFDAVHTDLRDELMCLTARCWAPADTALRAPLASLEAALRIWFDYLKSDPRRARIMLIDASVIDDLDAVRPNAAARESHARILRLVETLHPDLPRHGIQLDLTVAALSGALISLARTWAQGSFEQDVDVMVRHSMLVFQGLAALDDALNQAAAPAEPAPAVA